MYQPYQNTNQFNQYQQVNMNEMSMRQYNQGIHRQNLANALKNIFQFQNQPELHNLVQIIQGQQKNISAQLDGCIKSGQVKKIDEATLANMRERCKKIKEKNEKILVNILNSKQKLSRMMYTSIQKNINRETQTIQLQQKIRKIKGQIISKFHILKSAKNQARQRSTSSNKKNVIPIKTVMSQLKSGTQMLEKQVVRTRQQMECVLNYIQKN